jgi:prevent-host-death family protein
VTSKISARTARAQFGRIINRAVENHERFLVERNGKPMVMILSVTDYVRTVAPPPDWLERSWGRAKRNGLEKLTAKEIDAEIAASRRGRRA